MDTWQDCSAWSRRILTAADRLSGYRHVRQRRYEDWWVHPDSADAVVRTLLTLSIHSLVLDALAQGQPYTPAAIGRLRPADVILTYDNASALTAARLRALVHSAPHRLAGSVVADRPGPSGRCRSGLGHERQRCGNPVRKGSCRPPGRARPALTQTDGQLW